MRSKSILLSIALILTASFWTFLSAATIPSGLPQNYANLMQALSATQSRIWIGYATAAAAFWILSVYSVLHLSRGNRRDWKREGFDESTIGLMTEKRGALSRMRILEVLRNPRHRGYISDVTGIDWREVDREVRLMQNLGLVEIQTRQGRSNLYGVTGKGGVALNLLENELSSEKT